MENYIGVLPDTRSEELKAKDWRAEEIASGDAMIPKFRTVKKGKWKKYTVRDQDGSGSCFPADTKVLMEDLNEKEINKVKIGDVVITHKGNAKVVTHLFKRKWQGTMVNFKIRGVDTNLVSTNEHPIYGIKKVKEVKPYEQPANFYKAEELKAGDWVGFPIITTEKHTAIRSFESDPDFLWALGLYLAEGSCDKYKVAFALHKKEMDYYEKLKKVFAKYGSNVTVSFKKKDNGMCVSLQGQEWVKVFSELGGKLCQNKKINDRLMFIAPALQMKIVEGVFDGDGCYEKEKSTLVSTSNEMIRQIKIILLRNGIYSFENKRKKLLNRKDVWELAYSKETRYSFVKENFIFVQISSKEKVNSYTGGHVYNIEVDGDNSYIVGGVAVHNCVSQAIAKGFEVLRKVHKGDTIVFSSTPIYQKRVGKPNAGMYLANALDIAVKTGTCREKDCKSQLMNDSQMDAAVLPANFEDLNNEVDAVASLVMPMDFDYVAAWIEQYGYANIHIAADRKNWSKDFPSLGSKSRGIRHAVAGVDAVTYEGVQYIVIEDSWGEFGEFKGQRLISREVFKDMVTSCGTITVFKFDVNDAIKFARFETVLEFGQKNDEVWRLQEFLKTKGCFPSNVQSTGYYGSISALAVLTFQQKYNVANPIEINQLKGKRVGAKTLAKINENL